MKLLKRVDHRQSGADRGLVQNAATTRPRLVQEPLHVGVRRGERYLVRKDQIRSVFEGKLQCRAGVPACDIHDDWLRECMRHHECHGIFGGSLPTSGKPAQLASMILVDDESRKAARRDTTRAEDVAGVIDYADDARSGTLVLAER